MSVVAAEQIRRDRLDAAMTTRAARWCAEIVAHCQARDAKAGRPDLAPGNIAHDYARMLASNLVRVIYALGWDPTDPSRIDEAWQVRALEAWGFLEYLTNDWGRDQPVHEAYERSIGELEAADAATAWQLRSERGPR